MERGSKTSRSDRQSKAKASRRPPLPSFGNVPFLTLYSTRPEESGHRLHQRRLGDWAFLNFLKR